MGRLILAMLFAIGALDACGDSRSSPRFESRVFGLSPESTVVCVATSVAARVILTAAHCLHDRQTIKVRSLDGAVVGRIVDYVKHPEFSLESSLHDLGVALLDREPVLHELWQPVPIPLQTGDSVTFYGANSERTNRLARRTGTMTVSAVGELRFSARSSPDSACGADSGGPVLHRGRMIGIVSRGDVACSAYTEFVRIAAYQDFVVAAGRELCDRHRARARSDCGL